MQQCGQTPQTRGQSCADLTLPATAGHYCSQGRSNQLAAPGMCCEVGTWFDTAANRCIPTESCNFAAPDYCGPSATGFPTQLASFISQPLCIGPTAGAAKPAGMSACCSITGGKFGESPFYDWTDASGALSGVIVY